MKKLLFFVVCVLALSACDEKKQQTADLRVQQERDSLNRIIAQKDNEINDMMSTFNDIEEGFRAISAAEQRVSVARQGEGASMKERIQENMQFIQQTMQQNRELINKLRSQLRQSSVKGDQLRRTLENLTQQLEEKDAQIKSMIAELKAKDVQIEELNTQVSDLKDDVGNLEEESTQKSKTISAQERTEGTAHHCRRRGAAFGLQSRLLHKDRHPRRQGNQTVQSLCQAADVAPRIELPSGAGRQQAVHTAH